MIVSEYPPLTPPSRGSFPMRNRIISGLSQGTLVIEAGKSSGALITAKDAILQGRDIYSLPGNIDSETAEGTNELIKDGATAITCAADILENYQYLYGAKLNLSILGRLRGKSELRRGALAAHGVEEEIFLSEAVPKETEAKQKPLSSLLHSKGCVDGETVKRMSGETEYPVYTDDKRKTVAEPETGADQQASAGVIPEDLDEKLASILRAMPVGEAVGIDRICENGIDAVSVMTAMTMLEIRGLVESLPGNRYLRK